MEIENQANESTQNTRLAQQEREELYRTLVRNFPNGAVLLFDRDLRYTLADGVGLGEVGLSSETIEGKTIWQIFPEEVCRVLEPKYRAALAGEASNFEVAFAGRIYQVHALPIGSDQGEISQGMVMTQDITERVRVEESLRESQQRYEQLVNTIDGIVWEGNPQTFEYYFVSKQAEKLLGYPVDRWINEPTFWSDHIHPEDRDWALSYCTLSTAQKRDHVFEYRMIAADGRVVWLRDIVTVVLENDQPATLRGVMVDITESKRVEAELREREKQYRSVFNSVADALEIIDLEDGRIVDFNPAAHLIHGYTEEEYRQLQPSDLMHPDSYHVFKLFIEKLRAGQEFRAYSKGVRKDGAIYDSYTIGIPFTYRGKPHALAVSRDVTEQVAAQKLLEQRVEERTRQLQTLLEVSRTIASTLELRTLLGLVLDQLRAVVDYTSAAILTVENGVLVIRAERGPFTREQISQAWFTLDNPIDHTIIHHQQPVVIDDITGDTPMAQAFRNEAGERMRLFAGFIRSWMGVPLIVKGKATGMIALDHSEPGQYSENHADLVMTFGNHVAVAIENARLYKTAQDLAALQERQKLARELHDSVSQALYGIGLGARTARNMLDKEDIDKETLAGPLDYVLSLANAALAEMRALIFELRPESLENEGLVAALSKQTAALQVRHPIRIETSFCEEPKLSLEAKETLYRIAQEALHNVVKHAQASQVRVQLIYADDQVTLEIQDDGIGFDPKGSFPGHLGLQSMRERAERTGGNLCIESTAGQGTRIYAQVPVATASPTE